MFNPIEFSVLAQACTAAGFAQGHRGNEITFERANHNDPRLMVIVYTSTRVGHEKVRAKGKDAIRVCLVAIRDGGTTKERVFGVSKAQRVFRTGQTESILARLISRMREMYSTANDMTAEKHPHCAHCGAPCFEDSGKCVARCWASYNAAKPQEVAPAVLPGLGDLTQAEIDQMNEVFGS